MKNLDKAVIMLEQNFIVSEELTQCLNQKGILFPKKYFKADSVRIPGDKRNLFFFLPMNSDSLK